MRGFSDPFFIKMLQLGRDVFGWLDRRVTRLQAGHIGTFLTTTSVMGTVYVTWRSYNNKRFLDKTTARMKRSEEIIMRTEAVYRTHEKEFKEYLARKNKMKSEEAEDNTFFATAGLG